MGSRVEHVLPEHGQAVLPGDVSWLFLSTVARAILFGFFFVL